MSRERVMAVVVGGIGVLGAVAYVANMGGLRGPTQDELDAAGSRGGAPSDAPSNLAEGEPGAHTNVGAGASSTRGGEGARAVEGTRGTSGEGVKGDGPAGSGAPGEVSEAERMARAKAVGRAADDATKRSRGTERTFSKDDVVDAMQAVKPLMKKCYVSMLDDFPGASGKVSARFTLEAKDEVGEVEVVEFLDQDTQFDAQMTECMAKALSQFTLPMAGLNDGSLTVTYPFTFRTDDEAKGGEAP